MAWAPFREIAAVNFRLAMTAVSNLGEASGEGVRLLLDEIRGRKPESDWLVEDGQTTESLLEKLPFAEQHVDQLRQLRRSAKWLVRGVAQTMIKLCGREAIDDVLELVAENAGDGRLCWGLSLCLRTMSPKTTSKKSRHGPTRSKRSFLRRCSCTKSLDTLAEWPIFCHNSHSNGSRWTFCRPVSSRSGDLRTLILLKILGRLRTAEAFEIAADLLLKGIDHAEDCFSCPDYSDPWRHGDWGILHLGHVDRLETLCRAGNANALEAIQAICAHRPDLGKEILARASNMLGAMKIAYLYASVPKARDLAIDELGELLAMSDDALNNEPLELLGRLSLDFRSHESLVRWCFPPPKCACWSISGRSCGGKTRTRQPGNSIVAPSSGGSTG